MLISATHTHTAPAVYGCHGNDAEPGYRASPIGSTTVSRGRSGFGRVRWPPNRAGLARG
jgi:hypothetical protein